MERALPPGYAYPSNPYPYYPYGYHDTHHYVEEHPYRYHPMFAENELPGLSGKGPAAAQEQSHGQRDTSSTTVPKSLSLLLSPMFMDPPQLSYNPLPAASSPYMSTY